MIGIEVHDTLRFFTGDHPATDFEKGTQQGGTYPCGGCGINVDMIDDPSHALRLPTRSLQELQTIATAGKFGMYTCTRNKIDVNTSPFARFQHRFCTHTYTIANPNWSTPTTCTCRCMYMCRE